MIKYLFSLITMFIIVFCIFAVINAIMLPVDFRQTNLTPEYIMLGFAVILGIAYRYVRKTNNVIYYIVYAIIFIASVFLYKLVVIKY